jgi:hypothetical protein
LIPKIIHQTWKTGDVPERFRSFQQSWRDLHPGWAYRLWTDDDNRAFIAREYSWFLPIFDAYPEAICRADAIRYFLLRHYGGVYADLDFEALEPLDTLLEGEAAVLGWEPERHMQWHRQAMGDRRGLVCNALMASPPGHPFWDHVIEWLVRQRHEPGPLEATGPFLMTRALETYRGPVPVRMLASEVLYPLDSTETSEGRAFDLDIWVEKTRRACAVHHWANTWVRDASGKTRGEALQPALPIAEARFVVLDRGTLTLTGQVHPRNPVPVSGGQPMVSCLMVTRDRAELAMRAVRCFLAQGWVNRELVILDGSSDDGLLRQIEALQDERIHCHRIVEEGETLGTLRNRAVSLARGDYVCQWDDDDLYDPARIELQMEVLLRTRAAACMLLRWTIWWPDRQRLAVSRRRAWEGSLLCERAQMPLYPDLRRGEDTPVAETLIANARVALLDSPRLYVYVAHEGNTFSADHFEAHWQAATARFEQERYRRALQELGKRLDLGEHACVTRGKPGSLRSGDAPPQDLAAEDRTEPEANHAVASPSGSWSRTRRVESQASVRADTARLAGSLPSLDSGALPSVLVLTPMRDAERFLPRYLQLLEQLDYPRDRLSLGILEGDSRDGAYAWLQEHRSRFEARMRKVTIQQRHYGHHVARDARHHGAAQYLRRRQIALARNALFQSAYAGEDYVLWIDVDVVAYPTDVLSQMLAAGKEILVPHCVLDPGGPTFDLNSFVRRADRSASPWSHAQQGIVQPPRGADRLYLESFRGQPLVELDAVGGTMLLVHADVLRDGTITFPPFSFRGYIETEGFAMMARDRGIRAWGMPDLEIVHEPD